MRYSRLVGWSITVVFGLLAWVALVLSIASLFAVGVG